MRFRRSAECVIDQSMRPTVLSKRSDRYRAGRSKDWIKVENRAHPAMDREL
jgi:hypothetical protein